MLERKNSSNADLLIRITVGYAVVGIAVATLVTIGLITHRLNRRREKSRKRR